MKPPVSYALLAAGLLLCTQRSRAQMLHPVSVRGQVSDGEQRLVLYPASVRNISSGLGVYTDRGGYFRINAKHRDTITITFVGYYPDTIFVSQVSGEVEMNRRLRPVVNSLSGVDITNNTYQRDSLERMAAFGNALAAPNYGLIDKSSRPQFGLGLVFTPWARFSKAEKRKRKFKKMYWEHERQQYIEFRYSNRFVSRVTGLKGDSLLKFINQHVPPYEELRDMSNTELTIWTTERYNSWIKQ